jgi:deoxycytidine triphosphate deaminase
MKISALTILELNEKYNLIEGLSERELNNPEGSGIDLRVGQVHKLVGDSLLGADDTGGKRYSPETELIGDIEKDGNKTITLKPGEYFVATTLETINAPTEKIKYESSLPEGYLIPKIWPRSSLQRGGVSFHATKTDPGYKGTLAFGIKNQGNSNFVFELGARMFNIEFEVVMGDIKRAYSGQHQGGRVTSGGQEEVQN